MKMRYTVRHISVDGARAALGLDSGKTADQIRAIVQKRGMEADAAIDAAMATAEFADSAEASWHAVHVEHLPDVFEVQGLKYDGAVLAGGFDWDVKNG